MPDPVIHSQRRFGVSLILPALLMLLCGCFVETSYPFGHDDVSWIDRPPADEHPSTRRWLAHCHRELENLLPAGTRPALLSEDFVGEDGGPINAAEHFKLRFEDMDTMLGNARGLLHTSHLASTCTYVDPPPPAWPGFEDLWIPISDKLQLSGRMALSTDHNGKIARADCIVILPGFLGDNGVLRSRDLAAGLIECGFHVLALELRGCGRTEARFPEVATSWGVFETMDLLIVSQWLQKMPHVQRTGLVGFCWGANIALLTAWADGRDPDDPNISPELAEHLHPVSNRSHYEAGVMAFSPALSFENLRDQLDTPRSFLLEPALSAFQDMVRQRQIAKKYAVADGRLRSLIDQENARYQPGVSNLTVHGLKYLKLLSHKTEAAGDKLQAARVPVLIVQGANDPLLPPQNLADLMAGVDNPNVAGIMLPGGGHVGFAAYAKRYYYSLIMNFFHPNYGPPTAPRTSRP